MNTGAILSKKDIRDYHISTSQVEVFPEKYKILPTIPVKNQSTYPTCTAHALSEIVEYHTQMENNKYYRFSTDFIYGHRNENLYRSEGMSIRDGLQIIYKYGDVLYTTLPGNSFSQEARLKINDSFNQEAELYKISSYYKINNIKELKKAVFLDGPVVACMKIYQNYQINDEYIYTYQNKKIDAYHAVLVVGWDKDNFIIQNSWGKYWGNKGYFKIPQKKMFSICSELYGTTDNIDSLIKSSKTINLFSKIINFILNLIFRTK